MVQEKHKKSEIMPLVENTFEETTRKKTKL
jgi:hypothetical protein